MKNTFAELLEEVDGIGDRVLDQLRRGGVELVGEQQGALVVAQVEGRDLAGSSRAPTADKPLI
ncbi:MAG: hypothetical protein OXC19_08235 [Bryobacterales bacterium]|nr:hypothetical protein [Bryobacterales bacterium]